MLHDLLESEEQFEFVKDIQLVEFPAEGKVQELGVVLVQHFVRVVELDFVKLVSEVHLLLSLILELGSEVRLLEEAALLLALVSAKGFCRTQ